MPDELLFILSHSAQFTTWKKLAKSFRMHWASQVAQWLKNKQRSTCHAGDLGSIPGWRRSPGGGNGNPLWYSCLENPMDRGAWWAPVHGGLIVSDMTEHICTQNVLITSFSVKLTLLAFFLLLLEPQSSVLSQYLGLMGMYSMPNKCTYS